MTAIATPAKAKVNFEQLRRREFGRLDARGDVYLDYTGSALYAESQIRASTDRLLKGVFGNPHSESGPSRVSTDAVESARTRVLEFFDADTADYDVVFTANASAAIKLAAESFPFGSGSTIALSADNHNSVNGIREYAQRGGATLRYLPLNAQLSLADPELWLEPRPGNGKSLFAFPAQSNFSGVQHPLSLIAMAESRGYFVLLDAAAFVPLNPLSLRRVTPHFVSVSFYKMFGYPGGIGALIARKDALDVLARPWFAGGTVEYASVQNGMHRLRGGAPGFEDGTLDFLGLTALADGFDFLETVGVVTGAVKARCGHLADILRRELLSLRHGSGSPMAITYGDGGPGAQGATVCFNILDAAGRVRPYWEFEKFASDRRIALRGGCFCNPGAAEFAFAFSAEETRACLERSSGVDFDLRRFAACMNGTTTGALRASVGIPTVEADIHRLTKAISEFA